MLTKVYLKYKEFSHRFGVTLDRGPQKGPEMRIERKGGTRVQYVSKSCSKGGGLRRYIKKEEE